jgi:hypothetical protein
MPALRFDCAIWLGRGPDLDTDPVRESRARPSAEQVVFTGDAIRGSPRLLNREWLLTTPRSRCARSRPYKIWGQHLLLIPPFFGTAIQQIGLSPCTTKALGLGGESDLRGVMPTAAIDSHRGTADLVLSLHLHYDVVLERTKGHPTVSLISKD